MNPVGAGLVPAHDADAGGHKGRPYEGINPVGALQLGRTK